MRYQDVIVRGTGTSLDALLTAEYLKQRHSLPQPEAARRFAGALTRAEASGVFRNVWHCDVRSLYPSIILAEGWVPAHDELGEFPRLLRALRTFRLEAKDAARTDPDPARRSYFQALQSSFKILINSFYGYLGFSQGTFNDYDMAERVTARGREILTSMLHFLNEAGAHVLEMDTRRHLLPAAGGGGGCRRLQRPDSGGPPGRNRGGARRPLRAMFSYKSKNYALLDSSGVVSITGAALKSRGLEPFQAQIHGGGRRTSAAERNGERFRSNMRRSAGRSPTGRFRSRNWPKPRTSTTPRKPTGGSWKRAPAAGAPPTNWRSAPGATTSRATRSPTI